MTEDHPGQIIELACQLLLQCELVGNDNLGGVVARVSPLARLHGGATVAGMVVSDDDKARI